MSYCRWSSDNFNCDLYCYTDVNGGYTTWIASNRVSGIPYEGSYDEFFAECIKHSGDDDAWIKEFNFTDKHEKWREAFDKAERTKIDLPYAGESFNDRTLDEFLNRLIELKELGYNFPDYVIDIVKEEIQVG